MPLTARDNEEIRKKPLPRGTNIFGLTAFFLRPIMLLPPIRRYLSRTIGGITGAIGQCWRQGDYEKAARIAIFGLKKYRHKTDGVFGSMTHHHWWGFMQMATESLEQLRDVDSDIKAQLITLAEGGIPPFEGYDVAYSYLAFSRWRLREKAYDEAIAFAKIASDADETWGEPDFLLGRCSFVIDAGDPIEHLAKAIKKDHRMLFRISNDKVCKRHPHVIAKLKELAVADGVVMGRGATMADDEVKPDSSAGD